jgi:hypothetical protein
MVREWLKGVPADRVLFPKLEKRRTWLMVKKDLESGGIPYETPDGVADFHAAGRHTHVTGLLRNGASLPEASALARHADVRTTMRYTHIGLEDQAKAVQRLPWHHNGTSPRVPKGRGQSSSGTRILAKDSGKAGLSISAESICVTKHRESVGLGESEAEATERVRFPPPPLI